MNIEETKKGFDFICSPNPAQDNINILTNGFVNDVNVEIFDGFGKLVYKETFNFLKFKNISSIDLSTFENGMYFIKIYDAFHTKTKQFVHI